MTDDCKAERNALRAIWPTAVLILCAFHVLKNEWSWLMSNEDKSVRQELMGYFKAVIILQVKSDQVN